MSFDELQFAAVWSDWSEREISSKFVVEHFGSQAGLVFDYGRAISDGRTTVTALLKEDVCGRGIGVVGSALFVEWLFRNLPLIKVTFEVYEFNATVLRMLRKLGISQEAELPKERFYDGRFWSRNIFSVYRAEWSSIRRRMLRVPGSSVKRALATATSAADISIEQEPRCSTSERASRCHLVEGSFAVDGRHC